MPLEQVNLTDDPRLEPYRELIERNRSRQDSPWFIAEGQLVVERLLHSRYEVHSVLATESHARRLADIVPSEVPLLVASQEFLQSLVGFEFHRGMLACGLRGEPPQLHAAVDWTQPRLTLMALPHVATAENLGSVLRSARALGAQAVLLGAGGVDPLGRRVLRVSMAAGLFLPVVRSDQLLSDLDWLHAGAGCDVIGTVLSRSARPLASFSPGPRNVLVLGNEAQGLDAETLAHCQHRVTIPMHNGTDSLNLAVAAGIFLHHFTSGDGPQEHE